MPAPPAKLINKTNAATIEFLNTELDTGLNFARMAAQIRERKKVRRHDLEKIKRYLGYAREAYDVVCSHVGNATAEPEELREIEEKISGLRKFLGDEKQP